MIFEKKSFVISLFGLLKNLLASNNSVKIHSGRLTDFRDVAALAKDSDLNLVEKYLFRGNKKEVVRNLKRLESIVNDKRFVDSFKGVFMEKKFDINIKKVKEISGLKDEKT